MSVQKKIRTEATADQANKCRDQRPCPNQNCPDGTLYLERREYGAETATSVTEFYDHSEDCNCPASEGKRTGGLLNHLFAEGTTVTHYENGTSKGTGSLKGWFS